jgi:HlyD family secretion protein
MTRWETARIIIAGFLTIMVLTGCKQPVQYRTVAIEKGDVSVQVTATGTVNPHTLVQVGTQVSGTLAKLYVDYNSKVKKGQVIARLDPTFLQASVEDAQASLRRAQAQENLAQRTSERAKALFDKGLASQADLDQALSDYESAQASLISAQAQLNRAKINLAYATITSPITGVVVDRKIDVGQTVAASLSAPTLFTIADDLAKMQVQAGIDEADVGKIVVGQKATFSVDAYPDRQFEGAVAQIRLQPTTTQNVVSYTVMIDVNNPDLKLLPGMTANITLVVEQVRDVLKVPLAALKFVPPDQTGLTPRRRGPGSDSSGTWKRSEDSTGIGGHRGPGRDSTGGTWKRPTDSTGNGQPSFGRRSGRGGSAIYILENDKLRRVRVITGLSDAGFVAVTGDIQAGQQVVVGILNQNNKTTAAPTSSPLSGGANAGMPRRF